MNMATNTEFWIEFIKWFDVVLLGIMVICGYILAVKFAKDPSSTKYDKYVWPWYGCVLLFFGLLITKCVLQHYVN